MTEQELIDQMVALTTTARSILQTVQTYGTVDQDVTFTAGGLSVTVQSVPKQVAAFNTAASVQRLAFAKDFGGAVSALTLTRNAAGQITDSTATFTTGWTLKQTLTRNGAGKVSQIDLLVKDETAATLYTGTRTVNYDASNRFSSIS